MGATNSCDRCKCRKQKCRRPSDLGSDAACNYCVGIGYSCITTARQRPAHISSAAADANAVRLALLEGFVKGLVPNADISSPESIRAVATSHAIDLPQPIQPKVEAANPGTSRAGLTTISGGASGAAAGDVPPPATSSTSPPSQQRRDQQKQQQSLKHQESGPPVTEELPVLRDQQGQTQYIGPASSYLFQLRMRALFGGGPGTQRPSKGPGQLYLFGRNPMERMPAEQLSSLVLGLGGEPSPASLLSQSEPSTTPGSESAWTPAALSLGGAVVASPLSDALVSAFFTHIHPDFPVLHEESFREEYERHARPPESPPGAADPTWLCSLLCVLLLARYSLRGVELLPGPLGPDTEDLWWCKVQALLPVVLFTSSISAVQALLLAALHLHNTNRRDSCWTLTGAAVRVAFAIGLHRDTIVGDNKKHLHTPVTRELRKRMWWTLFTFEMMQASSLDRPSAIEGGVCSATSPACPRGSILGSGSGGGDAYDFVFIRLAVHLGRACHVVRQLVPGLERGEFQLGPLSPAATLRRDLAHWKMQLPPHLQLDAIDGLPPAAHRPVLLMHIMYHYVLLVLSRSTLLTHATQLAAQSVAANQDMLELSEVCIDSAQESARLLMQLDAAGRFDPVSWWDLYYLYMAALTLTLSVIYEVMRYGGTPEHAESRSHWLAGSLRLLQASANLSDWVLRAYPSMPGTMHRYAIVICDVNAMAQGYVKGQALRTPAPEPAELVKVEQMHADAMRIDSPNPLSLQDLAQQQQQQQPYVKEQQPNLIQAAAPVSVCSQHQDMGLLTAMPVPSSGFMWGFDPSWVLQEEGWMIG